MSFYIQRIALQQLRRFEAFEIDALSPGLNIIAGPNGAGKSSLARAIRAAFLDRFGSKSAADLQPIGNSGAAPTVRGSVALLFSGCESTAAALLPSVRPCTTTDWPAVIGVPVTAQVTVRPDGTG